MIIIACEPGDFTPCTSSSIVEAWEECVDSLWEEARALYAPDNCKAYLHAPKPTYTTDVPRTIGRVQHGFLPTAFQLTRRSLHPG